MASFAYDINKKQFDCYESQCTSIPTLEKWSKPLYYAINTVLQKEHIHGTFNNHVCAATGIFLEQIHLTTVQENGLISFTRDDEVENTENINLVNPYSTDVHDISSLINLDMLKEYSKNIEAFKRFVSNRYDDVIKVPTFCATYPIREKEKGANPSDAKSKILLNYGNLGKWWMYARSKMLTLRSVLQQTQTLRACALIEDFTEIYYSQPEKTTKFQSTYYHTLKEVMNLPHSTQLTEHVLHEFVADALVARLAVCLDKASSLAQSAYDAHVELSEQSLLFDKKPESTLKTLREDAANKFEEWKSAVIFYAANEVEHALSTFVLFWRDSYVLNLIVDSISPTQRLDDAPKDDATMGPLCPICATPMIATSNTECIMKAVSACNGNYFACKYHSNSSCVCSNHLSKKIKLSEDYEDIKVSYRLFAKIKHKPDAYTSDISSFKKGFLLDIGTWRYSPSKHTQNLCLRFLGEIENRFSSYRGPTPLTLKKNNDGNFTVICLQLSPLLKIPEDWKDFVVFAGYLPSLELDEFGSKGKLVTFRAKRAEGDDFGKSRSPEILDEDVDNLDLISNPNQGGGEAGDSLNVDNLASLLRFTTIDPSKQKKESGNLDLQNTSLKKPQIQIL